MHSQDCINSHCVCMFCYWGRSKGTCLSEWTLRSLNFQAIKTSQMRSFNTHSRQHEITEEPWNIHLTRVKAGRPAHMGGLRKGEWNFTQEAWGNRSALMVSVLASTLGNFIMGAGLGLVCVCVCPCGPQVICDNNSTKCDIRHTSKETQRRPWRKAVKGGWRHRWARLTLSMVVFIRQMTRTTFYWFKVSIKNFNCHWPIM